MALVVADRVQETTTTTGTGTYTLAGAKDGFQSFAAVGDGNTTYYACTDGTDYEVGIGTYTATGTTLARTTIIESSNSDLAVSWGAGEKDIFVTLPASKAIFEDASNNVAIGNNITVGGTVDGVDIAARDAVLTSTTTTANAALPKAGGTMTGNIVMSGAQTVDGRDLSVDGAKLDNIEANADVTDATNVSAAGAAMTSGATFTGDVNFSDDTKAGFGTSSTVGFDIEYSTGLNSLLIGTRSTLKGVYIRGSSFRVQTNNLETAILAAQNGEVQLYYDNAPKFETTSTGINVTGTTTDDGATHDGDVVFTGNTVNITFDQSADALKFDDGARAYFGSSSDLTIYHEGVSSETRIWNSTGDLNITNFADDKDVVIKTDNGIGGATTYFLADGSTGEVQLYAYGSPKLKTQSGGIDVTGTVTDDGATHDGDVTFTGANYNVVWDKSDNALEFADDAKAVFGASSDLEIYHSSPNNFVVNNTGSLYIRNNADDSNVFIQSDNGSGGLTNYFAADGSSGEAQLYHYGSEKLATQSGGINVTGTVTDDGATHDGDVTFTGANYNVVWDKSADSLAFPDNAKAVFGTGSDYSIYCDGAAVEQLVFEETGDGSGVFNFKGNLANLVGPIVRIEHDITAGENTSIPGTYQVLTKDAGGTGFTAFSITAKLLDNTSGASTSEAQFAVKEDGNTAPQEYLKLDGDAENVQILKPLAVTGDIIFEGATADDFETTVTVTDPTADQTITLPDQTGKVMLWQNNWPDDPNTTGNQAIGANSLESLTTGILNVAYGREAGQNLTSGSRNTAIGDGALKNATMPDYSTAVGERAATTTSTGSGNTAIGGYALGDNSTGSSNVAVGYATGRVSSVNYGTYVGYLAGNYYYFGGSKSYQTLIGYSCGDDSTSDYATAVGARALSDGSHYQSVAVGYDALGRYSTYYPYYNTAVGYGAGNQLYSGDYNILVGQVADTQLNTDSYGVAIGSAARAGLHSVAVGHSAMASFSGTVQFNTCVGSNAGYDMDTGATYCVFLGYQAGYSGGTGSRNTGCGTTSLRELTTGAGNSACGMNGLRQVTQGSFNSALGEAAGYNLTTGSNNTFLGYQAGYRQDGVTTNGLTTGSNVTCLGFEALPSSATATNEITLGDNDITSLRCNVQTISSLSDERDKTAISDIPYGLDFINDMRPVQFTWNRRDGSMGAKPDIGFIAQELYETELDHSSSSRTRLVNWADPNKLEADYVRSYPILVKAVQELSAKCDALEARLAALEGA